MAYDSPNYNIRNEQFSGESGGGATTEYMRFRRFQKMRVKAVHAVVTVAGTTTGHGFDIYHGTTSKGTLPVLGTSAAGVAVSNTSIDFEVPSSKSASSRWPMRPARRTSSTSMRTLRTAWSLHNIRP